MLGYMTAREALAEGFSHYGRYYGIPVWLGDIDNSMMVATKWGPLEHLMTAFHVIEGTLRSIFFPDDEPVFQFQIGAPIEVKNG